MKLYKISLLALALTAGVFTSCSDDDNDYVVGAQSAGAYFSNDMSTRVVLNSEATTAVIPLLRTVAEGAETVTISVTDESGLFTIPTSVSFEQGAKSADITITYDPSKLEADHPYPVTFAVGDGSQTVYGPSKFDAKLVMKSPVIEEEGPLGTYTYAVFFSGEDPDLSTTISYSEKTPQNKTYTVHHWGYDVDLNIILNEDEVFSDGTVACYVPEQYIGYDIAEGPVYIADLYSYTGSDNYLGYSYYDPETGLFSLAVYYHLEDGRGWDPGYEYFQLDGFPDYSVSVTYDGVFITAGGKHIYAVGTVNVAPDVEEAMVANIVGSPTEDTLDDIISGNIPSETLAAGLGQEVRFEIDGSGSYTMIVVALSKGEPVNLSAAQYDVELGSGADPDDANWVTVGYAPYVDGWITGGLGNPFDHEMYVEVQAYKDIEGILRLHNPYMGYEYETEQGVIYNEGNGKANVVIDARDPELVVIPPQYSGFDCDLGMPFGAEWYIGNYEGVLVAAGAEDLRTALWNDFFSQPYLPGATIAEVLIDQENNSYIGEEGIYVPLCLFGGKNATEFGYNWNSFPPAIIDINNMVDSPEAAEAPARKAISAIKRNTKLAGLKSVKPINIKSVMAAKAAKSAKKAIRVKVAPLTPQFSRFVSKKTIMK